MALTQLQPTASNCSIERNYSGMRPFSASARRGEVFVPASQLDEAKELHRFLSRPDFQPAVKVYRSLKSPRTAARSVGIISRFHIV